MINNDTKPGYFNMKLSHLGLLKISGIDAKKLLQGQFTCNLDEVDPTQSRLAAHCNPQGRIISFFRIFLFHDDYYLQMPNELIPVAMHALQKYAAFFKVSLSIATSSMMQIGYDQLALPNLSTEVDQQLSHDQFIVVKIAGCRYIVLADIDATLPACTSTNHWKYVDIQQGIAAIYPDTSEKFLPHEINLPSLNAVSFNKGCYTGQEIIARIQYKGKVKSHFRFAIAQTHVPIARGQDLYCDHQRAGSIVDYGDRL